VIWWPAVGLAVAQPDIVAPWPDWLLAELFAAVVGAANSTTADRGPRPLCPLCPRTGVRAHPQRSSRRPLNAEAYSICRLIVAGALDPQTSPSASQRSCSESALGWDRAVALVDDHEEAAL
jgi:hypothetical protein